MAVIEPNIWFWVHAHFLQKKASQIMGSQNYKFYNNLNLCWSGIVCFTVL